MKSEKLSAARRGGFTIVEVLISTALMYILVLAFSKMMVNSSRSTERFDIATTRLTMSSYLRSIINSEAARCNSINAGGNLHDCITMCRLCKDGDAGCTWGGSGVGNCRYYGKCSDSLTDGVVGNPAPMYLKDFQTVPSDAAHGRTGGDGLTGLTFSIPGGNKINDGYQPCGGTYEPATSACRWRLNVRYQPDWNDSMRFYFTLSYEANESDDPHRFPDQVWESTFGIDEICSTL
jgi:hypothetical protein